MNLNEFFAQGLSLIGPFKLEVVVFLFLLCLIGEAAGLFVPYLFETTWLLIGFQLSQRALSPGYLMLLLMATVAGRETGALALYYMSSSGSTLFAKYRGHFRPRVDINNTFALKLFHKMDVTASPFSVAVGRLFWLRIPLTLMLGVKRKLKVLLLGVALSSLVYEGIYVTLGAVLGTTMKPEPLELILYSLSTLTVLYIVTFAIRRLIGSLTKRRRLETAGKTREANLPQETIG